MKQITADLQRLIKADPGRHYEVKIMATNKDVEVGFQYTMGRVCTVLSRLTRSPISL